MGGHAPLVIGSALNLNVYQLPLRTWALGPSHQRKGLKRSQGQHLRSPTSVMKDVVVTEKVDLLSILVLSPERDDDGRAPAPDT